MSLPVVYRRRVQSDLAAAFDWYEEHSPGLGEMLLSSVASVFKSIEEFPEMLRWCTGRFAQKIEILRQWEQDATLMGVAEEEGMPGPQPKLLQPIRDALHALNYWPDTENSGPSKA